MKKENEYIEYQKLKFSKKIRKSKKLNVVKNSKMLSIRHAKRFGENLLYKKHYKFSGIKCLICAYTI